MSFVFERPVCFGDTDAGGVVYFAKVLTFCHEAYEASLAASGVNLKAFFSGVGVAVPIVHAAVDFWRPMYCGDRLSIQLTPKLLTPSRFEVHYQIYLPPEGRAVSQAMTRHACIHAKTRQGAELPDYLQRWLHQWQGDLGPVASEPVASGPND